MIQLDVHPDGVVFGVKAAPGARSSAVTGEHAGLLKVAVTQVAEKGKANQALIAVIAKALTCPSPTPLEEGTITVGFARQAILDRADANLDGAVDNADMAGFMAEFLKRKERA